MAYGAILGQMPQIDGIPAVIESYPIATGNTIAQGDVVDVVDGQIQRTLAPQANVETVIQSNAVSNTSITVVDENKALLFFLVGNNIYIHLYDYINMSQIQNGSIANNSNYITSDKLNEENVILGSITSSGFYAYICSISEDNLSTGSVSTIYSGTVSFCKVVALSENSFLAIYNRSGLKAKVCTVSGTSISAGTEFSLSSNTSASYISATRLPDSGTTRRVCVCYSDGGDSNKGKAVIVSINANNNVTWGTPIVFTNVSGGNPVFGTSCSSSGENILVSYAIASIGYVCSLSVSGNSITTGITLTIGAQSFQSAISFINDTVAVLSRTKSTASVSTLIYKTSGTFESGNEFQFNSGACATISSTPISDNEIIICYSDGGNSSYGTATILTVSGDQIAGSFLDGSKDAIALQSGTSGQSIEVIYSGITNADWVTEGQVIDSNGVYGVGVLDGVLQVWSKDRPGVKIETGNYAGTGTYGSSNPNSITFSFEPKFLILYSVTRTGIPTYSQYLNPYIVCFDNYPADFTQYYGLYDFANTSGNNSYGYFSDNTFAWYNQTSSSKQLNEKAQTYYYYAIG